MTALDRRSKQHLAAMEQNKAAEDIGKRRIHRKTDDVAIVFWPPLSTANVMRVMLRFKWDESYVQRPIGKETAASPTGAFKLAWDMLRLELIIENNGWTWAEHGNGH